MSSTMQEALNRLLLFVAVAVLLAGEGVAAVASPGVASLCTILFDQDAHRPARLEDSAAACVLHASQSLRAHPHHTLYLVGTADRVKDNQPGHGRARAEQDMSGEDLRYADVAAYRALNTKAYMVRWLHADPTRIVPLTTYEDGQWVAVYEVANDVPFKKIYGKETAPILARPCTVKPCATGPEEFLLPQEREPIR
jgi:hypothetical protein